MWQFIIRKSFELFYIGYSIGVSTNAYFHLYSYCEKPRKRDTTKIVTDIARKRMSTEMRTKRSSTC